MTNLKIEEEPTSSRNLLASIQIHLTRQNSADPAIATRDQAQSQEELQSLRLNNKLASYNKSNSWSSANSRYKTETSFQETFKHIDYTILLELLQRGGVMKSAESQFR